MDTINSLKHTTMCNEVPAFLEKWGSIELEEANISSSLF